MRTQTTNKTTARTRTRTRTRTARRRVAACVAVPLLAFSAACGGGEGVRTGDEVASAPETGTPDGTPGAGSKKQQPEGEGEGKSEGKGGGKGAFYDAQMKYVRCMRTEGEVEDFPDPRLSGYLDWPKIDAITDPNGSGEEQKGGKNGVCGPEMAEAMKLEPERDVQQDYESMLAHAQCMRDKGVSKFANPTMSGGNVQPGGESNPMSPSIDRNSPAYKEARQACKDKLLEGLDGMQ